MVAMVAINRMNERKLKLTSANCGPIQAKAPSLNTSDLKASSLEL